MEKATTKALKEEGLIERQVSAMLRLRVSEVSTCDSSKSEAIQEAMVTVWRPTQEHVGVFKLMAHCSGSHSHFILSDGLP